jgi:AsmA protein
VRFTAYGGAFTGRLGASPAATPPTWRVDGTLEHLDVGAMLAATTTLGNTLAGNGRLRLDVTGRRDLPVTTSASGTIAMALTKGVIRNFPLLAAINRSLQITEGSGQDTAFDRLGASFTLSSGTATTRDLQLVAGALTVSGAGTIGLESQALALSATARFTREKSAELSQISKHVSGAKNANGEVEIPLTVRGTLQAPDFQIEVGKILERAAKKEIERGIKRELNKLLKP